jgi:hypothetical protein
MTPDELTSETTKQQHLADARWPVEQAASAGKRRAVRDCAALAAPS